MGQERLRSMDDFPWFRVSVLSLQSSVFLCLSQARINWDGCGRKCIRHKKWGIDKGVLLISPDGVAPTRIVGVPTYCYPP